MSDLKSIQGSLVGKKFKPDIRFDFTISIPEKSLDEFALLIEHDGQNDANVNSMLKLADEGKAPYCVSVGVKPGNLTMPDGTVRGMSSTVVFPAPLGPTITTNSPFSISKVMPSAA